MHCMCNETLTETLEENFGSSDTCNNFVKNHITIDGNKHAHRIPLTNKLQIHTTWSSWEGSTSPPSRTAWNLTTKDHKSTHKSLSNIATQLRWHNNKYVCLWFRCLSIKVTLSSTERQATQFHILPAGQLVNKTLTAYTKESTGLSN